MGGICFDIGILSFPFFLGMSVFQRELVWLSRSHPVDLD